MCDIFTLLITVNKNIRVCVYVCNVSFINVASKVAIIKVFICMVAVS